jgi:acetyltransferase-like isoleucine patch superfamily enzyme
MSYLSTYLSSFFDKKRYYKKVSLLSLWDKQTKFHKEIYMGYGVKLINVSVGKYTRIRQFTAINHTQIGKYSSISRNVRIGMGEHPTNLLSTNSVFYSHQKNEIRGDWVRPTSFDEYKPVNIGNDVWIGEYVSIKGGVTIGHGAIIASKAFVTKDVPPYAIVGGIPAKIIRYRFDNDIIDLLLKIKWWDLPETEIEKKLEAFTTLDITKEKLANYFDLKQ